LTPSYQTGSEATKNLFSCPEEGCVKSFLKYSSLQSHLECGKHKRALEHETLFDKAITEYALHLEVQNTKLQEVVDAAGSGPKNNSSNDDLPQLSKGWAL
jgi:hypothetical protein